MSSSVHGDDARLLQSFAPEHAPLQVTACGVCAAPQTVSATLSLLLSTLPVVQVAAAAGRWHPAACLGRRESTSPRTLGLPFMRAWHAARVISIRLRAVAPQTQLGKQLLVLYVGSWKTYRFCGSDGTLLLF